VSAFVNRNTSQPLQDCEQSPPAFLTPRFQSKPWAGIGQRFQRYQVLGHKDVRTTMIYTQVLNAAVEMSEVRWISNESGVPSGLTIAGLLVGRFDFFFVCIASWFLAQHNANVVSLPVVS